MKLKRKIKKFVNARKMQLNLKTLLAFKKVTEE